MGGDLRPGGAMAKQRHVVPALRGLSTLKTADAICPEGPVSAPSRLRRAGSLPFLPSLRSVRRSVVGLLSSRGSRSEVGNKLAVATQDSKPVGSLPELERCKKAPGPRRADGQPRPALEDAAQEARKAWKGLDASNHTGNQMPRDQELENLVDILIREVYQEQLPCE
ncbi:unnamed protein product, partial [Symbiodinium natans]